MDGKMYVSRDQAGGYLIIIIILKTYREKMIVYPRDLITDDDHSPVTLSE